MSYTKPVFGTLSQDSENCGCCFYFTDSGQGIYVYSGDGRGGSGGDGTAPGPSAQGPVGLGPTRSDPHQIAQVTPLCGSGLPATQPITFGVPVGATGIHQ